MQVIERHNALALPCTEDYSPCTCVLYGDGTISVDCDKVPVGQIQAAFNRTTRKDLYRLDWALLVPDDPIPADILSGKRAGLIRMESSFGPLVIDRFALTSSGDYTTDLILDSFDLSRTDFSFLENFARLVTLSISSSSGIQTFGTLPPLPALKELSVFDCTGFESLQSVPGLKFAQLENLRLNSNQLSDSAVEVILGSVDSSALAHLSLNNNRLTRVPDRVPSMARLERIFLSGNVLPSLSSGSLAFQAQQKILEVYLPSVSLSNIQVGAFEGDFGEAQVVLDDNQLDQLDSQVFLPILQEMIQTTQGNLYLFNSYSISLSL